MLKFLDCTKDAEAWDALISTADPHYTSAYYRAYGGGQLAVYDDGAVVQPFRHQGQGWIGNAYNFGGPLIKNRGGLCFSGFIDEFSKWKQDSGLKERCTVAPFTGAETSLRHECFSKDVVVVNREALNLRSTTRHSIEKQKQAGFVTQLLENPSKTDISLFSVFYHGAMARKNAKAHWWYPAGFFHRVLKELGPKRSSLFFTKDDKGRVVSGCIVIYSEAVGYYHWAARSGEAAADALQVYTVIQATPSKLIHLGGGLTENDGILTFKRGFADSDSKVYSYIA